jgi:hypothetical protein
MVALTPGAPEFSVGDFIWQEIKHLSEDPKNICSYSPYIMYMIEKGCKDGVSQKCDARALEAQS